MRRSLGESVGTRGGVFVGLLVVLTLLAASCSTDTIGPIPQGASESAASEAAPTEPPDDLAFANKAASTDGPVSLSSTFVADGLTFASDDGALLVTCGSAGIDVESDGRPIDRVTVSSDGEVRSFLDLSTSIVSVNGAIQIVWVDFDGVEQRFDC